MLYTPPSARITGISTDGDGAGHTEGCKKLGEGIKVTGLGDSSCTPLCAVAFGVAFAVTFAVALDVALDVAFAVAFGVVVFDDGMAVVVSVVFVPFVVFVVFATFVVLVTLPVSGTFAAEDWSLLEVFMRMVGCLHWLMQGGCGKFFTSIFWL